MASKWINAILWSLVSINLLILVLGGLVTWLGYAIPIRLRQFGLSPEITQLAGFASLLVACLGLGGLNYSSHYALNAYGFSCAIFIILVLLGALPDHWQQAIYNPSANSSGSVGQKQPQLATLLASTANGTTLSNTDQKRPKPDHPHGGGLVLDLLYIVLLLILSFLLTMAFIVAQYLRRREIEEAANVAANNMDCEDELADCYSNLVTKPAHSYPLRAGSIECNPMTALARQRQLIMEPPQAATNNRNSITDWNCTCNEIFGGGGINTSHRNELAATMANQADVPDNEFVIGRTTGSFIEKDEIRIGRRQVSNIGSASARDDIAHKVVASNREPPARASNYNNEMHASAKRTGLQSVTPDRWAGRAKVNGGRRRHTSRLSSRLGDETDGSLMACRVSSRSLADSAINNNGCGGGDNDGDSGEELAVDSDEDISGAGCGHRNDRVASISGTVQAGEQQKFSPVAPLVQKGIYYAGGRGHELEDCSNPGCPLGEAADEIALLGGYHTFSGRSSSVQRRHQSLNNEHRHVWDSSHCYNHHHRHHQRHRTGPGREAGPSYCSSNSAASNMNTIAPCDLWFGLNRQF